MGDLINLRRFKKAKAREESARAAEINRQAFGRTKQERQLSKAEAKRAARSLDAHKREPE